jgi:hypothetical protein
MVDESQGERDGRVHDIPRSIVGFEHGYCCVKVVCELWGWACGGRWLEGDR